MYAATIYIYMIIIQYTGTGKQNEENKTVSSISGQTLLAFGSAGVRAEMSRHVVLCVRTYRI